MGGTGQSYTLDATTADKGSSNGITWTAFKNISDATGTVVSGSASSLTGTAAVATLNDTAYASNLTVTISGANAGTSTNVANFSGVSAIDANAAKSNTMGGTGQSYTLDATTADKGSSNGITWTAFKNISDATGTVVSGSASSLTGTAAVATLNDTAYASNLTVTISGANAGTSTNVANFSGVSAIDANAAKSNTMGGTGQSYTLDATTADKGSSNGITWTAFKNISDATGTVVSGSASSLTGTAAVATLNYSAYASNLTVTTSRANAGTSPNVANFSGVSAIDANAAKSNTMGGTGQSYALDAISTGH